MPDCEVDPQCELVGTECAESKGDVCTSYKQIWSCLTNRTDCVEWELTCAQPGELEWTHNEKSTNAIGEFIAQASVAKMVQENTTIEGMEIRIFGGKPRDCKYSEETTIQAMIVAGAIILYWGGYVEPSYYYWLGTMAIAGFASQMDCCKVDNTPVGEPGLDEETECGDGGCQGGYPDSLLEMLFCTDEESELAKARGAKYTKYIGKYCSEKTVGFCTITKEAHCEFDNLFSRIVQEQGRQQIADALSANVDNAAQVLEWNFNYYVDAASSGWVLDSVNGNRVAYWAWDKDCLNSELVNNPPTNVSGYVPPICPFTNEVYVASCEGNGCNALPITPFDVGSTDYYLNPLHAYRTESLALNSKMFISGSCDKATTACYYKINAYPSGQGASRQIAYDLTWLTSASNPGWSNFEYDVGGSIVVPYEYSTGTSAMTQVAVKIDDVEYLIPKDTGGEEFEAGGLMFIGSCNDEYHACTFRAYKTVMLNLIPWGSAKEPNCRGFTPEEIEALDFSAMDLSEWIATIIPKVDEDEVTAEALGSVATFEEAVANGVSFSDGLAKVVYWKELIFHPFDDVKFYVLPEVKVNSDLSEKFFKVHLNWGDGTPFIEMPFNGTSFAATRVGGYRKASGPAGYKVKFALFAESGRIYETEVKILVGLGSDSAKYEHTVGGGVIRLDGFAVSAASSSSLMDAHGGG